MDIYTQHGVQKFQYLRCISYRQGCRASGKVDVGGEFAVINGYHNHPRTEDNIRARDFKRQLREAAVEERGNLKNIYERIAARNPEDAVFVPYNSVRSSMLRWRQTTTPNIPANLEELAEILLSVSDGHRAVIFGNQDFLRNFMESQYVFMDGTFKAVPRRPSFSQILTILAICMDHAFPIIHVFMERRTRGLYDAVFAYLLRSFPHFVNENIITDYEVALTASLTESYPQSSLRGCFFHFCQAVLRKAKMLGVVRQIEGNANGRILLRKYYALALLPSEIIVPVFESLQADNAELNGVFRGLHDYVRRQWIEQVTPIHLSVFKQRHRTNNVMESYHRRLNSKLVRHPGIWDLMETLIDIQNTATIELAQLEMQGRVFRVAKKNVLFHTRLDEAWNKLEDGRYNAQDFLRQAIHLVEGLDRQLHQWNEDAADEEDVVPALVPPVHPLPQHPSAPNQNEPPPLLFFQPQPQLNLAEAALPHAQIPVDGQIVFPHPIQLEPPPLIFFNDQPPEPLVRDVTPPPDLPVSPDHNIVDFRPPSPPSNFPPSPDRFANTPSPTPLPDFVEAPSPEHPPRVPSPLPVYNFPPIPEEVGRLPNFPPSPDRFANTPSPPPLPDFVEAPSPEHPPRVPSPLSVYNSPPIPEEVGRLFAEFDNEDLPAFENIVDRRWEPTIPATEYDEDSMSLSLLCKVCYLNKVQYILACGHVFCSTCACTLFNVQAAKCAICRANLGSEPRPFYL